MIYLANKTLCCAIFVNKEFQTKALTFSMGISCRSRREINNGTRDPALVKCCSVQWSCHIGVTRSRVQSEQ